MGQVHGQVQSRLGARPVRAGRRAEPGQPRQRLVPRGRPYPHDRVQRRLEGAGGAAPAQDRLEVGHRVHRRDAADPARRHLLGLLEGARPGRHRPQDQAQAAYASIADRFDFTASWPPRNWAAASRCRRVPRRSPTPRSPRRAPTLACAVPCSCSGWAGAPRPCLNGTSRCAASDRQLMAAAELARAENIYDRVVNTSDRTENSISASASSRPSRAASRPRPTPSRWTRPGSTA